MPILRAAASLALFANMLPMAALAQETVREEYSVTSRRNFDGSRTTQDSDGYSVTTRRNFDGGYTTKDNEGNSVTCRPMHYTDETRCKYVTVRPAAKAGQEMPEPVELPEPPAPSDD